MSDSARKHSSNADLTNVFANVGKAKVPTFGARTHPRGQLAVNPDGPAQHASTQHISPYSDRLSRPLHADEIRPPAQMNWSTTAASSEEDDEEIMPSMFSTPESSPSRRSPPHAQKDIGLIMPRPSSAAGEHPHILPSRPVMNPHASRKWVSPGAYIKASAYTKKSDVLETPLSQNSFRRATITQFPAPYQLITGKTHSRSASEAGEASLVSDLDGEAGGNSMVLKGSAPALETTVSSGKLLVFPMVETQRRGSSQRSSNSAIEELRALEGELWVPRR